MCEIHVRFASPADAQALAELNLAFNEVDRPADKIRQSLALSQAIRPDCEIVAVAVHREEVIGFACARTSLSFCYDEPSGEITEMYVKETYRRQRVATRLINFLEQAMSSLGVKQVRILTGFRNYAAQAAYKANGYVVEDELVLSKHLK